MSSTPLSLMMLPLEIRFAIYPFVIEDVVSVRVGPMSRRKPRKSPAFNAGNDRLQAMDLDDETKLSLKGSVNLLKVSKAVSAEFSPLFYHRIHVVFSFESAGDMYDALNYFITVANPALLTQLRYLTIHFRVMRSYGMPADRASLGKTLAMLPNLDMLTLNVSDGCRQPRTHAETIIMSTAPATSEHTRWMSSTLRRLQVAMHALPQFTKVFFKNCQSEHEDLYVRHTVRMTGDDGVTEDLVSTNVL